MELNLVSLSGVTLIIAFIQVEKKIRKNDFWSSIWIGDGTASFHLEDKRNVAILGAARIRVLQTTIYLLRISDVHIVVPEKVFN